jgi:hypothetical protein
MSVKSRLVLGCLALALTGSYLLPVTRVRAAAASAPGKVSVIWGASAPESELKSWDFQALGKLKAASAQEKDPASGKLTHYKGVLLSQVLDQAMESLSVDRRAQVDLVVLQSATGEQVLLPRSVLVKYPVMVALQDGKASIVMPWTSKPKILQEGLPIESYFVKDLTRVELSNYRERYSSVFLKRRTDPLAMRGEKIFVQNCISCHTSRQAPALGDLSGEVQSRRLASGGHPVLKGSPKLNDRDRRAVGNYLDAYRGENQARAGVNPSLKGSQQAALPKS